MRYAKQKSTGKILEGQGGGNPDNPAHLQTLKDNAISSGIAENDIEVGYADDDVNQSVIKAINNGVNTTLNAPEEVELGTHVGNGWSELAKKYELDISITNYKPLIIFKLNYGEANNPIATLFIQEMLKRGYLASTSIYVTYAHTIEIANKYLENVNEVFEIMSDAINNNKVLDLLET